MRNRRLERQIEVLRNSAPGARRFIGFILQEQRWWLRIPTGFLLCLGGLLWFLPVLGFWMLPLGLLLLAFDIPAMQPAVGALIVRARRRMRLLRARLRRGFPGS